MNLSSENLVSIQAFAFKCNVYRYSVALIKHLENVEVAWLFRSDSTELKRRQYKQMVERLKGDARLLDPTLADVRGRCKAAAGELEVLKRESRKATKVG